jgi:hypothetical protein
MLHNLFPELLNTGKIFLPNKSKIFVLLGNE